MSFVTLRYVYTGIIERINRRSAMEGWIRKGLQKLVKGESLWYKGDWARERQTEKLQREESG